MTEPDWSALISARWQNILQREEAARALETLADTEATTAVQPADLTWANIGGKPLVVSGSVNGTPTALTLWTGTAGQYAAISEKSSTTVYIVTA